MRQSQWDMHLFAGVVQTQAEAEEKIRQVLGSIDTANVATSNSEPNSATFQGNKSNSL